MYKAKKTIWIFFILLSFVIYNFASIKDFVQEKTQKTTYNTYVDTSEFSFISKIDGYSKSKAKIKVIETIDASDIIISNASDKEISGFKKYEKQFYSPIIMFVPEDAHDDDNTGFLRNTHGSGLTEYHYIQKDLKIILEAIEENKSYIDIGINEDIFGNGKVKLAIPYKNSECYNQIVELITLTLCDYDKTLMEDTTIKKRVENILKQCVYYEDASTYILNICDDWSDSEKTIVLAPEYICINDYQISSSDDHCYIACIPSKTINIYYDLYLRNNEDVGYYDNLLNSLTKEKFINKTGLRNKERNFNMTETDDFMYNPNSIPALN